MTSAQIEALRAMWTEGTPMRKIAEVLGVTKDVVVGRVHRLELPGRPSPIRAKSAAPKKQRKPHIRPVPSDDGLPYRIHAGPWPEWARFDSNAELRRLEREAAR